ncbi:phage tail assembly protein [Pseudomonas laurylsulfatiphila]|uniref:phage tail assembly protein n=1 Tax=Pseudomonas laurylsulfatiphila TaxID=2011015 RepID=UPI003D1EAC8B
MSQVKPYKLAAPIQAHDQEVLEVTLRRPTVAEVRAIKALPYKIDKNEDVSLDMEAAAKYIAICAGIPSPSVNQLDLSDLNNLAWEISGFFMTAASAKPEASAG